MHLKNLLLKQMEKRFIANSAIMSIDEQIEDKAKQIVLDKYQNKILKKNKLDYNLFTVKVITANQDLTTLIPENVTITLFYFCTSSLTEDQKKIIEKTKIKIRNDEYFTRPKEYGHLYFEYEYELSLDEITTESLELELLSE